MENIGLLLYGAGTLAFLALGLSVLVQRGRVNAPGAALFATFGLALWQGLLASHTVSPLPARALLGAELLRSLALVVYLACTLKAATGHWARATATTVVGGMAVALPALVAFALPALDTTEPGFTQIRAWTGVFISVGLLIALEQVFRNALPSLTLVRAACIALGITVIYDLYLFSDTLIFERLDPDQWRARAGVNLVAALFLSVAVLRNRATRAVSFSRNVVFYTASLTAAGIFLLTISVMGYLIRSTGGSWGSVLQLMLFFSSLLLLAAIAVSQRVRDEVRVFIAKNFFTLRYDYRQEWLNLIAEMSGKGAQEDLYVRAIRLLADLYKCPGGVLWLKQDREFLPVAPCRMKLPEDCPEPADSGFCEKLRREWIFELDVEPPRGMTLPPLPEWAARAPEIGIFVPLLVEDELIGFVGMQRSLGFTALTWEDLEILKTSARQIASYIARYQAGEQLARARQFDTYNQLTAFIMHDLKNLIAQQELVVKNAAKHKNNPAFVEDAIDTIQNSVARMSTLLGKLQQREPAERRAVGLQEVLVDAVKKCENLKPAPALRIADRDLRVLSDRDHLVMIVSHIIKNAQEATPPEGFVDVRLRRDGNRAAIEVEDNGSGMDAEFVRQRLFKPFESTKAGKGMGIGAYQAREFVRNLGGEVLVASKPGSGTTFTLTIPLAAGPAGLAGSSAG